jgi:hypothetical protein
MKFNGNDYYLNFRTNNKADGEQSTYKPVSHVTRLTIKLQLFDHEESDMDICLRPPNTYFMNTDLSTASFKLYGKKCVN